MHRKLYTLGFSAGREWNRFLAVIHFYNVWSFLTSTIYSCYQKKDVGGWHYGLNWPERHRPLSGSRLTFEAMGKRSEDWALDDVKDTVNVCSF